MARVLLDHVRKVYDNGFVAVHGASFEVRDGEFVVFVGPSGCGKSTLLRMVAGLEPITAGALTIGDRLVNDVPPRDRDIAMVFQNYALYPHMSVRDNLSFGLRVRKFPRAEVERRVGEAAAILGLDEVLDRKPGQLSGGQRQRVAVGRAIVRKPEVFLFDEPLSNLDAKLRVQMRAEIARLHRRLGATMVYVTHDQVEAMTMGERIVVMRDGEVQQIDAPLALYGRPANRFVAGFIGSPAMNFVEGWVEGASGGLRFRADGGAFEVGLPSGSAPASAAGRAATLGFRPEHLAVAGTSPPGHVPVGTWRLDVLEPMGNEVFLYASVGPEGAPEGGPVAGASGDGAGAVGAVGGGAVGAGAGGGHSVVARVPPQALPAPGDPVALSLDAARLHLFDAETGEALAERAETPVAGVG